MDEQLKNPHYIDNFATYIVMISLSSHHLPKWIFLFFPPFYLNALWSKVISKLSKKNYTANIRQAFLILLANYTAVRSVDRLWGGTPFHYIIAHFPFFVQQSIQLTLYGLLHIRRLDRLSHLKWVILLLSYKEKYS